MQPYKHTQLTNPVHIGSITVLGNIGEAGAVACIKNQFAALPLRQHPGSQPNICFGDIRRQHQHRCRRPSPLQRLRRKAADQTQSTVALQDRY